MNKTHVNFWKNATNNLKTAISRKYCHANVWDPLAHIHSAKPLTPPEPNIALISAILLIGTCMIALILKRLRRSYYLPTFVN